MTKWRIHDMPLHSNDFYVVNVPYKCCWNTHELFLWDYAMFTCKSYLCTRCMITMYFMKFHKLWYYRLLRLIIYSSQSRVSVSFHRVLGVLVPKKYSCVPRVMSCFHDTLSQAMIYRIQSVMWLRKTQYQYSLIQWS